MRLRRSIALALVLIALAAAGALAQTATESPEVRQTAPQAKGLQAMSEGQTTDHSGQ